jgi:hypothetical protein
MAIEHARAFELEFAEVEEAAFGQPLRLACELGGKRFQSHDVFAHEAEHRRMKLRMGKALQLVHVVGCDELARSGVLEIPQRVAFLDVRARERVIPRAPGGIHGERRMRLVKHARLHADRVVAVRDTRSFRAFGKLASIFVVVGDSRHLLRAERDELVRALQIVVLQRRLVNVGDEGVLVLAVRLHGIEVLRPLGERRIENVAAGLRRGVRIVPIRPAARGEQRDYGERCERCAESCGKHRSKFSRSRRSCISTSAHASRLAIIAAKAGGSPARKGSKWASCRTRKYS